MNAPPPSSGLHHLELWTADLAVSEPAWHWLMTTLGWRAERVEGWELGRIWRHADGSVAAGIPDPVLAEIGAERSGAMREIVATIQGEQDIVIRADIDQALLVLRHRLREGEYGVGELLECG